jgi:anti-sigma-K factor RskA
VHPKAHLLDLRLTDPTMAMDLQAVRRPDRQATKMELVTTMAMDQAARRLATLTDHRATEMDLAPMTATIVLSNTLTWLIVERTLTCGYGI